jgi:hypothetical protein
VQSKLSIFSEICPSLLTSLNSLHFALPYQSLAFLLAFSVPTEDSKKIKKILTLKNGGNTIEITVNHGWGVWGRSIVKASFSCFGGEKMKKLSFLLFLCFIVLCLLFFSGPASATIVLNEPFNYADNAALNAAWNAFSTNPTYTLDTAFGNAQPSYSLPNLAANNSNRLARNLGADYNGSDAQPMEFSFDIYLPSNGATALWGNARQYVELRGYSGNVYGSGTLENVVAIGLNNASTDAQSNRYFQGRVTNWYTLDAFSSTGTYRTTGWHTLMAQIKSSTIDFYFDGTLAETISRPNSNGFDCVALGSGLTSGGWGFWADNVRVETVPEPATLLVLGIGSLILRRRS